MILSMSSQAADFLASALGGFAVGVFFDLFRVLRKALRHKTAVTTAQDQLLRMAFFGLPQLC